jgi:hypothetical protein
MANTQQQHRTRRAVVVGESNYSSSKLPGASNVRAVEHSDTCDKLFACRLPQDARAVYAKLTAELGFAPANTRLLVDVKRVAIRDAFRDTVAAMGSRDVILFYFSGHVRQASERAGMGSCAEQLRPC